MGGVREILRRGPHDAVFVSENHARRGRGGKDPWGAAMKSSLGRSMFVGAWLSAAAASAQAPAVPPGVIYMATNFCPAQTRPAAPTKSFVKVFGALLPRPLPEGLEEAEAEKRFLLACELKSPAARRERLISELIVHTASGPADGCPAGSIPADGRALEISSDQALFTLLGTDYGGDGKTTFKLPDLRLKPGVARQSGGALRFCIVQTGVYPGRP
jgi:hypothetical protein